MIEGCIENVTVRNYTLSRSEVRELFRTGDDLTPRETHGVVHGYITLITRDDE